MVAGLIGCNNGLWKRPQFDIWGNTVNMAQQMDTMGVPGRTHVTSCVVEVLKSLKNHKFEFEERIKATQNNRSTYIVKENIDRDDDHHYIQKQQPFSNYHQPQYRQVGMVHKNPNCYSELDQQQPNKIPAIVRSPQNSHRIIPQLECDQSLLNTVPVVTVHPQYSYYNAMIQQELRQKHMESQKTPPPPPPRSPPPVSVKRTQNTSQPMLPYQHGVEINRHQSRGTLLKLCIHNIVCYLLIFIFLFFVRPISRYPTIE